MAARRLMSVSINKRKELFPQVKSLLVGIGPASGKFPSTIIALAVPRTGRTASRAALRRDRTARLTPGLLPP